MQVRVFDGMVFRLQDAFCSLMFSEKKCSTFTACRNFQIFIEIHLLFSNFFHIYALLSVGILHKTCTKYVEVYS